MDSWNEGSYNSESTLKILTILRFQSENKRHKLRPSSVLCLSTDESTQMAENKTNSCRNVAARHSQLCKSANERVTILRFSAGSNWNDPPDCVQTQSKFNDRTEPSLIMQQKWNSQLHRKREADSSDVTDLNCVYFSAVGMIHTSPS